MTDDELDRRLRQAMSVTPSTDLQARVRSRIAAEPAQSAAWRWVPSAAGGALAVAAVMAVVTIGRPPQLDTPSIDADITGRVGAVTVAVEPDDTVRPDIEGREGTGRAPRRAVEVTRRVPTPALLFAAGEAEAFKVLLAFSRAALAAADAEPSEVVMPVDPPTLQPLDIQPVEVAPLVVADAIVAGGPQ